MTFITAVAKKKDDTSKEKGEVMESNIDAMEVMEDFTVFSCVSCAHFSESTSV